MKESCSRKSKLDLNACGKETSDIPLVKLRPRHYMKQLLSPGPIQLGDQISFLNSGSVYVCPSSVAPLTDDSHSPRFAFHLEVFPFVVAKFCPFSRQLKPGNGQSEDSPKLQYELTVAVGRRRKGERSLFVGACLAAC